MSTDKLNKDIDQLGRAYAELGKDEPPPGVDQAVLRAATAAVTPRRKAWPWTRGWTHNLATVGVVVLAITLLVQLRPESPQIPPVNIESSRSDSAELMPTDPAQIKKQSVTADSVGKAGPDADLSAFSDEPAAAQERREREPQSDAANPAEVSPVSRKRETIAAPAARSMVSPRSETSEMKAIAEESVLSELQADKELTAQEQLDLIRQAINEGDEQRAMELLNQFRTLFPDHPVPDDLLRP